MKNEIQVKKYQVIESFARCTSDLRLLFLQVY